ncbi:hypothetical protein HY251_05745 [bacterium]|nr:hypothetical protein [bacterium]
MDKELGFLGAVALTSGLSLLHAALPNHWLPFVLVGRALKWSRGRTLAVLALAGGGHVVATSALGLLVWFLGDAAVRTFKDGQLEAFAGKIAGSLLVVLGLVYLLLHAFGRHGHSHAGGALIYEKEHESAEHESAGHEHDHDHEHEHEHEHEHASHAPSRLQERGAILTLFLALTFSPCEAVVGAFLAGVRFGFGYVLLLAIGSSVATVLAMLVLTWLTLAGVERLRFAWLDRNEMSLTGILLVAIGVVVIALPT